MCRNRRERERTWARAAETGAGVDARGRRTLQPAHRGNIAASQTRGRTTSERILEARTRAGLSQSLLAVRAAVPQPNLSAYESGRVQPRPETLARILAATAERPSVVLERGRERVFELAARRRAGHVRVFGSIARGTDANWRFFCPIPCLIRGVTGTVARTPHDERSRTMIQSNFPAVNCLAAGLVGVFTA